MLFRTSVSDRRKDIREITIDVAATGADDGYEEEAEEDDQEMISDGEKEIIF